MTEGKCILVGTHANQVPDADVIMDAVFNEMNAKYPSFIQAKLAIDSVSGLNINLLKKEIYLLAQSQVFLVHFSQTRLCSLSFLFPCF